MIRGWLTRQRNGEYMFSTRRPLLCNVGRTPERDAYLQPGDAFGYRNMCAVSVRLVWGLELEPLESVRVWCNGGRVEA